MGAALGIPRLCRVMDGVIFWGFVCLLGRELRTEGQGADSHEKRVRGTQSNVDSFVR
jgi:hypothetical protein